MECQYRVVDFFFSEPVPTSALLALLDGSRTVSVFKLGLQVVRPRFCVLFLCVVKMLKQ